MLSSLISLIKPGIFYLLLIVCANIFFTDAFATVPLTITANVSTINNLTDDITLTFTFDKNVTGFTIDDVTVTNANKGTFSASSPKEYRLLIKPIANGIIQINVASAAATGIDAADGDSESAALNIPTVPLITSFSPADNATNIAINAAFSITFSEPMKKGTGNITIRKTTGNAVVRTINVATATSELTFSTDLKTVTINPDSPTTNLEVNTDYNIQMPSGTFTDDLNNAYPGITNATTWNFKTTAQTIAVFLFSSPVAKNNKVTVCDRAGLVDPNDIIITFSASPLGATNYKFRRIRGAVNQVIQDGSSSILEFKNNDFQNGDKITVEVSGTTSNSIEIEKKQKPTVSITSPANNTAYNSIDESVMLVGNPANGVFSGEGVVKTPEGYKFFPQLASINTHKITYTYPDPSLNPDACTSIATIDLVVRQQGSIFGNLKPEYCADENSITLDINSITGEVFVYYDYWDEDLSKRDWKELPAPNNKFDPSQSQYAGREIHYIGYQISGITQAYQIVRIKSTPNVGILGLSKLSFCTNEAPLTLSGTINGETNNSGIFTVQGPDNTSKVLTNRIFDPGDSTVFTVSGTYKIIYKVTNESACSSSAVQNIKIQVAPKVNFSFSNTCASDTVVFTNRSSAGSTSDTLIYTWDFGDGFLLSGKAGTIDSIIHNGQTTGTYDNPKHKYLNTGSYIVKLSVSIQSDSIKTVTECASEKQMAIVISPEPQAQFTVTKVCANDFTLFDGIRSSVTIAKWSWDFGDGDTLTAGNGDITNDPHGGRTKGSFENPEHQYAAIDTYTVKLTVESDKGCTHTLIKTISIFPQIAISPTLPYREDFETNGKNGWVIGGKNPSWQLRTTNISPRTDSLFIQYAASGQNAWITNDDSTYNNNEFSYVESPCFDLSLLSRPMIVIKTAYFTDFGLDGAILQATIDDGVSWKTVGELQEGENWYNTALIIAHPDSLAPINDRAGWSGIDTLWKESRFPLDDFKNQPLVRFRIAFGSNSENTPGIPQTGFAFDDVFIGERSRIVLLEHFTNTNSDAALPPDIIKINDKAINTFINNEAVVLRYHVEIPGKDDPINQENKVDPSARALLYGVSSPPRTVIDGQSILNGTRRNVPFITSETNTSGNFGPKQYKSRTLVQSPFSIDSIALLPDSPETTLPISVVITKTDISSSGPFVVQIALVQKSVVVGTDTFKNVVRKLLPNAAGTRIDDPAWAQGTSKSIKDTLVPGAILGPLLQSQSDGFAIAVFIQDEGSKEVYQALIKNIPADLITSLVTGIEEIHDRNVTIYPNPASKEVHLHFSQKSTKPLDLTVFDAYGKTIDVQIIERGTSEFILNTATYSNGFYILETRQHGSQLGIRKKLVIAK